MKNFTHSGIEILAERGASVGRTLAAGSANGFSGLLKLGRRSVMHGDYLCANIRTWCEEGLQLLPDEVPQRQREHDRTTQQLMTPKRMYSVS